ncbi:hypothetical protein [Streptomyces sp. NEAU-YJ-81]|uniref:hypothetical protein n=1 Tax=Streptomyces sp. NEAU-YJ-81 TaxID=2820288 RepID=UPI001FBBCC94|nr:hypothetical protein [Streptomyces sp. NEAU-YJ-81]
MRGTGPADDERLFARDLRPLKDDAHLLFALRIHLPEVQIITGVDDDGVNVWIHDGIASWATLTTPPTGRPSPIRAGRGAWPTSWNLPGTGGWPRDGRPCATSA